jgi:hypothetical protein
VSATAAGLWRGPPERLINPQVAELDRLMLFFSFERAEITDLRKAVEQIKTDLPAVLEALRAMIEAQHSGNGDAPDAGMRVDGRSLRPMLKADSSSGAITPAIEIAHAAVPPAARRHALGDHRCAINRVADRCKENRPRT